MCSRAVPLLVLDYCFIKHAGDERFLTVLVGRLYPARAIFAVPCSAKGADVHATRRLAAFLRAAGTSQFTFMCDQEGALKTMMAEAMEQAKAMGEYLGAVPENSAVGESQSNGRAERAVQQLEDHVRTFLGELEHRLGQSIKSDHPILAWLVEYAAVVLNKYHVQEAIDQSAYEFLHGRKASDERLA